MKIESNKDFNERRALAERVLAGRAADRVQAIPHGQLAKLHADEARAIGGVSAPEAAPSVDAVDGNVTIAPTTGKAILLTPQDAMLTADNLLASARQAARRKAPI